MEFNEIRWDYSGKHPERFYFVEGSRFYQYNVTNNAAALIHEFANEFPAAVVVHNNMHGNSSGDSRYWAFQVEGDYDPATGTSPVLAIITYDKTLNQIVGTLTPERYRALGGGYPDMPSVRTLEIAPSGKRMICGTERCQGVSALATNWTRYTNAIYSTPITTDWDALGHVEEQDTAIFYQVLGDYPIGPATCFLNPDNRLLYVWCSDSAYYATNLVKGFSLLTNHLLGTPPLNTYTHTVPGGAAGSAYYHIRVE